MHTRIPRAPPPPLPQAKDEMRSKEALLRNFFSNVDVVLRAHKVAATAQRWEGEERALQRELDAAQRRVHEALCDNINTQVGQVVGRVGGCGCGSGWWWIRRTDGALCTSQTQLDACAGLAVEC